MPSDADVSQEALTLASELIDDIELSRLPASALLLKASRLARFVDDEKVQSWLSYELNGFPNNELGRWYMARTSRWINEEEGNGYWDGLATLEAALTTYQAKLDQLVLPNVSGEYASIALREIRNEQNHMVGIITPIQRIRSKVIANLHDFVANTFHELSFSQRQEALFEQARREVDAVLAPVNTDALHQVESIYRRLGEGDTEAISQALNTCRRLIDGVADAVYPPTAETIEIDGNTVHLGAQHHQNGTAARLVDTLCARDGRAGRMSRCRRSSLRSSSVMWSGSLVGVI